MKGRRCPRVATVYAIPYKVITGYAFGAAGIETVIRLRTVVCGYIDSLVIRFLCIVQRREFGHREIVLCYVTSVLRRPKDPKPERSDEPDVSAE